MKLILSVQAAKLLTYIYADVEAQSDADAIKRNYKVTHLLGKRERMTALAGFVLGPTAYRPELLELTALAVAARIVSVAVLAALLAVWFGLWFDIRLNKRRNLLWHYIGQDPATANADKFANKIFGKFKIPGKAYAAAKVIGCLILESAFYLLLM